LVPWLVHLWCVMLREWTFTSVWEKMHKFKVVGIHNGEMKRGKFVSISLQLGLRNNMSG
jgi:hypothetical protein